MCSSVCIFSAVHILWKHVIAWIGTMSRCLAQAVQFLNNAVMRRGLILMLHSGSWGAGALRASVLFVPEADGSMRMCIDHIHGRGQNHKQRPLSAALHRWTPHLLKTAEEHKHHVRGCSTGTQAYAETFLGTGVRIRLDSVAKRPHRPPVLAAMALESESIAGTDAGNFAIAATLCQMQLWGPTFYRPDRLLPDRQIGRVDGVLLFAQTIRYRVSLPRVQPGDRPPEAHGHLHGPAAYVDDSSMAFLSLGRRGLTLPKTSRHDSARTSHESGWIYISRPSTLV